MIIRRLICCVLLVSICYSSFLFAQEKKLEKLRVGGGSASATQTSLWLAKEANYYEKHGLNVEVISIPGSSLALQAMLSGQPPIIQAQDLEKQFPKAKGAKPGDFADSRFVRELHQSGFIKSLHRTVEFH